MNEETYLIYEKLFIFFKCLSVGEIISIAMTLLAQLHTYPEMASIYPLTIFPHWGIKVFGEWAVIAYFVAGAVLCSWADGGPI